MHLLSEQSRAVVRQSLRKIAGGHLSGRPPVLGHLCRLEGMVEKQRPPGRLFFNLCCAGICLGFISIREIELHSNTANLRKGKL
eukprot:scaffold176377_cov12-Tisochrysis_lutea.AAC.1